MLGVLIGSVALPFSVRASLSCSADAAPKLNPRDKKLCAAGVESLDATLNARYKAAVARLSTDEQRTKLREEQRAWLQTRNRCESTGCFTQAYETRIRQLDAGANPLDGQSGTPNEIAVSDIRQVVQGSMVGFVQANEGQTVPDIFLAPDGKPDMVFAPRIKGQQDTHVLALGGKKLTFETYFGQRRFNATLLTQKVGGNLRILGLRLVDKTEWALGGLFVNNSDASNDDGRVGIADSPLIEPRIETLNVYCDSPGGHGITLDWKAQKVRLDRQVVVRTREPEYPCQAPREEPQADSFKRWFRGDFGSRSAAGDRRSGAFIQAEQYIIHLDARRQYGPVEMLTPQVMLLDSSLMGRYREKVKSGYEKQGLDRDECATNVIRQVPQMSREERHARIKRTCPFLDPAEYSAAQFIQTFVPEQWRKLWAN